eukprot:TRINITY_DN11077_c0_g1_i8.p1 TRINITY_DN11077_c0_g1~~TRINITY_DN11077_c0_g1_i8.p1  ORF type:complete len:123 (-),score=39.23 TRINITY_DN11077_c0_g1_i8:84-407(-)
MLRSLVGSEMCIRDRVQVVVLDIDEDNPVVNHHRPELLLFGLRDVLGELLGDSHGNVAAVVPVDDDLALGVEDEHRRARHGTSINSPYSALIPVSYTHLTLPTKRIV